MIGSNKIEINEATMIQIVQYYFDNTYKLDAKVTGVISASYSGFSITIEGKKGEDQ